MPRETSLKSRTLDDKDKQILMILQANGRESLTKIAKKVKLSIDSVNSRIKEMQRKEIFNFSIFINPRKIGYELIADVKIKLHNITQTDKDQFINHLRSHKNVVELLSIMGDFDLTCVIVARNTDELDTIATQIRQDYSNIISDWKSVLALKTHKFEEYDLIN